MAHSTEGSGVRGDRVVALPVELRPNRRVALELIFVIFAGVAAVAVQWYFHHDAHGYSSRARSSDQIQFWMTNAFLAAGILYLLWREFSLLFGRGPVTIGLTNKGLEYRYALFPSRTIHCDWEEIGGISIETKRHPYFPSLEEKLNGVVIELANNAPKRRSVIINASDFAHGLGASPAAATEILRKFLSDVRESAVYSRTHGGKITVTVPRGLNVVENSILFGPPSAGQIGVKKIGANPSDRKPTVVRRN